MKLSAKLSGKELRQLHLDLSNLETENITTFKVEADTVPKSKKHIVTIYPKKNLKNMIEPSFPNSIKHHRKWNKKFNKVS